MSAVSAESNSKTWKPSQLTSISGLRDVFDPQHICNHSDEEGRYSFRNQPTMGMFAVAKLADALAEIIGCELELEANSQGAEYVEVAEGWGTKGVEAGKMGDWRKVGLKPLEQIKEDYVKTFTDEYTRLMRLVSELPVFAGCISSSNTVRPSVLASSLQKRVTST